MNFNQKNLKFLTTLIAILVSVILLIFTRKLSQRILKGKKKRLNADRCIDQQAVVTEDINNLLGKGQVNIKGAIWTARSETDEIIQKGELVTVKRIEGVKVIVNKI